MGLVGAAVGVLVVVEVVFVGTVWLAVDVVMEVAVMKVATMLLPTLLLPLLLPRLQLVLLVPLLLLLLVLEERELSSWRPHLAIALLELLLLPPLLLLLLPHELMRRRGCERTVGEKRREGTRQELEGQVERGRLLCRSSFKTWRRLPPLVLYCF